MKIYRLHNSGRFIGLFLAILMFASSTVYAIDIHFCEGEFSSLSLYGKAEVCADAKEKIDALEKLPPCCRKRHEQKKSDRISFSKKSCCSTDSISTTDDCSSTDVAVECFQADVTKDIPVYELSFVETELPVTYYEYDPPEPLGRKYLEHRQLLI